MAGGSWKGLSTKSNYCYTFKVHTPDPQPKVGCVSIHTHNDAIAARPGMVNPELLEILVCPETKQTLDDGGCGDPGAGEPGHSEQEGFRTRAGIA